MYTTTTPTFAFAFSDLAPIITQITDALSITNLVSVLAGIVGTAVVFVFFWWGIRKCTKIIMGAFKKGSLKL